mmetsp:Transcript_18984/g.55085  ORF Transcript_18984/g.55085 Transcript_18984/m.55085 type:complete len:242 (-) Transcript_18984:1229-1954(-)
MVGTRAGAEEGPRPARIEGGCGLNVPLGHAIGGGGGGRLSSSRHSSSPPSRLWQGFAFVVECIGETRGRRIVDRRRRRRKKSLVGPPPRAPGGVTGVALRPGRGAVPLCCRCGRRRRRFLRKGRSGDDGTQPLERGPIRVRSCPGKRSLDHCHSIDGESKEAGQDGGLLRAGRTATSSAQEQNQEGAEEAERTSTAAGIRRPPRRSQHATPGIIGSDRGVGVGRGVGCRCRRGGRRDDGQK